MNGLTRVLLRIHWLRVLLGAVVVEAVLLGAAIPLDASESGRAILLALVIPLCVIGAFLGGWWVARRAGELFLLHGFLLGVLAVLIYWALTWKMDLPAAYIVANYLKLIGGTGGGVMARAMLRNRAAPAVEHTAKP
jgi:putative membrane protein (TIGR04086 family)